MSATERLRDMLAEQGTRFVEARIPWEGYKFSPETMVGETVFDAEGEAVGWIVGPVTCHSYEVEKWQGVCMSKPIRYVRSLTIHVMKCSACGCTYENVNGNYEYCPNCGAKVVTE